MIEYAQGFTKKMTGTIGFIIGAISVTLFAYSATRAYRSVPPRLLQLFATAFALFAAAMLLWAYAVAVQDMEVTRAVMLGTDVLLLLATGCMLLVLLDYTPIWLVMITCTLGALLAGERAYYFPSTATVRDGLLYFNLSSGPRDLIAAAFLLIWLPATVRVVRYLAADPRLSGFQGPLLFAFSSLIVSGTLFLAARRSVVIIILFAAIAVLFLLMAVFNFAMTRVPWVIPESKAKAGKGKARAAAN